MFVDFQCLFLFVQGFFFFEIVEKFSVLKWNWNVLWWEMFLNWSCDGHIQVKLNQPPESFSVNFDCFYSLWFIFCLLIKLCSIDIRNMFVEAGGDVMCAEICHLETEFIRLKLNWVAVKLQIKLCVLPSSVCKILIEQL